MSKKKEPRRAIAHLSPESVRQILRGESVHIRLRNVAGEEQILQLVSPCTPPETRSVQRQAEDLLDSFNDLMNITGKGAPINAKERRSK